MYCCADTDDCFFMRRLKVFGKLHSVLHDLWEGIVSLGKMKSLGLYMFYSFAIWLCYYLHFSLTLYCFDFTANLTQLDALRDILRRVIRSTDSYAKRRRSVALCCKNHADIIWSGSGKRYSLCARRTRHANRINNSARRGRTDFIAIFTQTYSSIQDNREYSLIKNKNIMEDIRNLQPKDFRGTLLFSHTDTASIGTSRENTAISP